MAGRWLRAWTEARARRWAYRAHGLDRPCTPPYHRSDCVGANCDDAATRERCTPF